MRKMKRNTGLYKYLLEHNLFEQGEEAIGLGKKEYRKQYLKLHKQEHRRKNTEHTISFTPIEEKLLARAALEHNMPVPTYLRLSAIAYTNKKYLAPRLQVAHSVLQNVQLARTQIERIRQEKKAIFGRSKEEKIEALLISIEEMVRNSFKEPPDLETLVFEAKKSNLPLADRLKKILGE